MIGMFVRLFALRPLLSIAILGVPLLVLVAIGLLTVVVVKVFVFVILPIILLVWLWRKFFGDKTA